MDVSWWTADVVFNVRRRSRCLWCLIPRQSQSSYILFIDHTVIPSHLVLVFREAWGLTTIRRWPHDLLGR